MVNYLLQGFLFGLAYVAPIGTQNLYVINAATTRSKWQVYQVALITIFFDITLALSCFLGVGLLIDRFMLLKVIIILLGSIIVTYIGIGLIRKDSNLADNKKTETSLIKTVGACFVVTWLNPQAIIDGSLLLGSFRASLDYSMSHYFIVGVCIASFFWFNSLATLVLIFRTRFAKAMNFINVICGLILIFYGLKLAYSFFMLIR